MSLLVLMNQIMLYALNNELASTACISESVAPAYHGADRRYMPSEC